MVAVGRARASHGSDALLDDPFAEPLVRAVGSPTFTAMIDGETDTQADPLVKGRTADEQIAVRTRFFDDFFIRAAGSGIRQAVILAAGLDTRAYRLAWPVGTVVFEVDQPEVMAFKTATLAGLGAEPAAEHRAVGIDLRADWPAALRAAGFDPARPTAWIAEGLLIYLPPEAQDRLFDRITDLSAPGSRVATEHTPTADAFSDDTAKFLTDSWRRVGLDLDMADLMYGGERNLVADYLRGLGWAPSVLRARDSYASHGFDYPDNPLTAAFGDGGYLTAELMR
ncbi:class I SAM-dependent methyltransferase [Mycolicibacterium palauense]|uniref:class I SAM-dependent methyltransferase n=1 Tax=Mycolicibacterium palauense TaxID=2034511 RepID=UPI000BFEE2B7|nr:class I SAM-dependent methyltransferase [Mycolicibacterium palauense]